MIRKIVKIDEELCDGCGLCVPSCAEGAIQIIDGKARLVADKLCDGLGACLGECPQGAIQVLEREADSYDDEAARRHVAQIRKPAPTPAPWPSADPHAGGGGCPGMQARVFEPRETAASGPAPETPSALRQWPVQLHLLNPAAPYFRDCDLLVAADCVGFALGNFHSALLKGRSVAIACPKLDETQGYVEKLAAILSQNAVRSLTVAIMEVPCCGGLLRLVQNALALAKSSLPIRLQVVSLQGEIRSEEVAGG